MVITERHELLALERALGQQASRDRSLGLGTGLIAVTANGGLMPLRTSERPQRKKHLISITVRSRCLARACR